MHHDTLFLLILHYSHFRVRKAEFYQLGCAQLQFKSKSPDSSYLYLADIYTTILQNKREFLFV